MSRAVGLLQLQSARRILQVLAAATADPTRSQITVAMRIYERDVLQDVTWGP